MLTITESQALYFRARRSFLAANDGVLGAPTPSAAAAASLGIQAQQLEPAFFSLAQRTAARANGERWSKSALSDVLFGKDHDGSIVRTWGQRDTVHLYDAAAHWRAIIACRPLWPNTARQGPKPEGRILEDAVIAMRQFGRPVTRKDLLEVVAGRDYTATITEIAAGAKQTPEHFAAGRVLGKLAYDGIVCSDAKQGSSQTYALRELRFPGVQWPPMSAEDAMDGLVRAYLRVYAPATAKDISHHFGGRVTAARLWLARLEAAGELIDVSCGKRSDLVALAVDAEALVMDAPTDASGEWPLRALPNFDTMLMAHADKTWTVPRLQECSEIWRKAARVLATVLMRGRLVATWTHKLRSKDVVITLSPLSDWEASWMPAFHAEMEVLAAHLGVDKVTFKDA